MVIYSSNVFNSDLDPTEYDGNMHSLDRQLDQTLVLVIKRKLGNDIIWKLPFAQWNEETDMKLVNIL